MLKKQPTQAATVFVPNASEVMNFAVVVPSFLKVCFCVDALIHSETVNNSLMIMTPYQSAAKQLLNILMHRSCLFQEAAVTIWPLPPLRPRPLLRYWMRSFANHYFHTNMFGFAR